MLDYKYMLTINTCFTCSLDFQKNCLIQGIFLIGLPHIYRQSVGVGRGGGEGESV